MAKQPTMPKSLQSRNQAPPVGESGLGADPSMRENKDTISKQPSELTDEEKADLEVAKLNAPDIDDDFDPDAEVAQNGDPNVAEDENEDILVRMLHDEGHQHVNSHPLENGTVISMKRKDFDLHRQQGVRMEEVGDDYDGDVYDVSEPWKPEQKDKQGNVITSEEIASEEM